VADRSVELFTAIYATLAADAGLTALIGPGSVYDHVTPGAVLPYVVIGDETATDYGAALVDGQEHTITIHTWSETPSSLQVKLIQAAIRNALHERVLALAAGNCVNLRQEFKETLRDPDGITHHGVQRFRAVTQN
jgi:hypothetical protein